MRRWVFRCCAWLNELLHSLQWCGFTTVGEDLFYKAWSLDCGVLAPFALFWLLLGMCFNVISEIVCAWRRIIALCAIVWLLPIVYEHVPFQITSSAKELSAFLTVVYFLPTVGDQLTMCLLKISGIGHKHMFFLCCGLTCKSFNGLLDQKTSGTCASCLHLEWANDLPFWFGLTWIRNTQHRGARRTEWSEPYPLHCTDH